MKINLGCGGHKKYGYINIDLNKAFEPDVVMDVTKLDYKDNEIEEVLAYHILEHFNYDSAQKIVGEWLRVLKPEGSMYIIVPDVDVFCARYTSGDFNLGQLGWGLLGYDHEDANILDAHKCLYNKARMSELLSNFDISFNFIEPQHCPQASDADWQLAVHIEKNG
jgi:predicted SAM-dependent methyltransferase